jgi:hypothetical protein
LVARQFTLKVASVNTIPITTKKGICMGAKILVVEAESAIAELLQINLVMDGHSVICVESAEDAHS